MPKIMLILAAIILAVAGQAMGMTGYGSFSLLSPYPILLTLPAFFGVPVPLVVVAYTAAFVVFSRQLLRGEADIPRRSLVLLIASATLSLLGFVSDWSSGTRYQGRTNVLVCASLSAAAVLALALLYWLNRRHPTLARSAAFHFILFAWLATYCVPYLGEGP